MIIFPPDEQALLQIKTCGQLHAASLLNVLKLPLVSKR